MILDKEKLSLPADLEVRSAKNILLKTYIGHIFGSIENEIRWTDEIKYKISNLSAEEITIPKIRSIILDGFPRKSSSILKFDYPDISSWRLILYTETAATVDKVYTIWIYFPMKMYDTIYNIMSDYYKEKFNIEIPYLNYQARKVTHY